MKIYSIFEEKKQQPYLWIYFCNVYVIINGDFIYVNQIAILISKNCL